ncbi:hypothetical protein D9613_000025 [Agrocybe pediades]|uniref:Uncharacterized protein n=1 Tax=Agrocybe pediades TaxID=84607 RepID=A0A8H4VS67_9AGAR|nr:hypothetical protein D9613_000025 [Agrocybe pediades]
MDKRTARYSPTDTEDLQAPTAPHTSLHQGNTLAQSIRNAKQLLELIENMTSETGLEGTSSQRKVTASKLMDALREYTLRSEELEDADESEQVSPGNREASNLITI